MLTAPALPTPLQRLTPLSTSALRDLHTGAKTFPIPPPDWDTNLPWQETFRQKRPTLASAAIWSGSPGGDWAFFFTSGRRSTLRANVAAQTYVPRFYILIVPMYPVAAVCTHCSTVVVQLCVHSSTKFSTSRRLLYTYSSTAVNEFWRGVEFSTCQNLQVENCIDWLHRPGFIDKLTMLLSLVILVICMHG
jgi:hypothetical protein